MLDIFLTIVLVPLGAASLAVTIGLVKGIVMALKKK